MRRRRRNAVGRTPGRLSAAAVFLLGVVVSGLVAATFGRASVYPHLREESTSARPTVTLRQPSALWVGDSYAAGSGAQDPTRAESTLTCTAMRWTCDLDAQQGTGYLADGARYATAYAPLADRLAKTSRTYRPDVVVVDAGRSDASQGLRKVRTAAKAYVTRVHRDFPHARLVMITPYVIGSTKPVIPGFAAVARALMKPYHGFVVTPSTEGWVAKAPARLVGKDHVDPTPAGHRYIARHLATDFRRLGLQRIKARAG